MVRIPGAFLDHLVTMRYYRLSRVLATFIDSIFTSRSSALPNNSCSPKLLNEAVLLTPFTSSYTVEKNSTCFVSKKDSEGYSPRTHHNYNRVQTRRTATILLLVRSWYPRHGRMPVAWNAWFEKRIDPGHEDEIKLMCEPGLRGILRGWRNTFSETTRDRDSFRWPFSSRREDGAKKGKPALKNASDYSCPGLVSMRGEIREEEEQTSLLRDIDGDGPETRLRQTSWVTACLVLEVRIHLWRAAVVRIREIDLEQSRIK